MKIFIIFLIFIFLFEKIHAISGADNEEYSESSDSSTQANVNLREVCPCDLTEGVFDYGCCCDQDCLELMLDQDYYDSYPECDKSSSFSKNLDSKLDYCDGHKKSLDDLYNPLVLAFKVLKKGFCLAKNVKPDDELDDKNTSSDDEEEKEEDNYEGEDYTVYNNSTKNFNLTDVSDFKYLNYNVPIALPSGMCLFGHYQIQKSQDYEVTCSYLTNNTKNIESYYYDSSTQQFYIHDNYYDEIFVNAPVIKKIEILHFLDNNSTNITHYYINNTNNDIVQDLTVVITFLRNESDYPRSGNPGYIKGKPLLIKQQLYKILPIDAENCNNDLKNKYLYFDNYMDNILTFEDFIIYGYKVESCLIKEIFREWQFGPYGNANINKNNSDWEKVKEEPPDDDNILLLGKYRYAGVVNNTQNNLYELSFEKSDFDSNNVYYFINKNSKPKKMKTKWWYAPWPGFIKLPQNIMYPFRIGTTHYSTKKN